MLRKYFKFAIFSLVLAGFSAVLSLAKAGSYEDFFRAIIRDDARAVQRLLYRGFDPNTLDPNFRYGLMIALSLPEPSAAVAHALVDFRGTNVNVRNEAGETPLMMAALKGELALAKKLIERGADVNQLGWAPLHYAATEGSAAMVSLLLEHYAFVDAESPNGTTPLMMAAQYGSPEAVKILLEAGALPQLKNQQGLGALDFAQRGARPDAQAIISAALRAPVPAKRGAW